MRTDGPVPSHIVVYQPCRMKEGQKGIYYLAADSKQAAESAPFTEQLVRKGYEVRPGICHSCTPGALHATANPDFSCPDAFLRSGAGPPRPAPTRRPCDGAGVGRCAVSLQPHQWT